MRNARVLWPGLVLGAAALAWVGYAAWKPAPPPDDDLGPAGAFALTERGGRTVRTEDLAGKVWVASFVFTRCAGPCGRVTGTMARLQAECADLPDLRLVTFTVDPEFDTPAVLRDYAERAGADAGRWLFLTGATEDVYRVIRTGFYLTAQPNEGEARTAGYEVMHDTRLVVVDRHGHIRGYFDGTDPEDLPKLKQKITALLREK
jgi:cytochrome oxidase Cu insertion factor (SCO1/SenC/PrrC family)